MKYRNAATSAKYNVEKAIRNIETATSKITENLISTDGGDVASNIKKDIDKSKEEVLKNLDNLYKLLNDLQNIYDSLK